jgi:transcriptional regulator with XRE-family HTH domain
MEADQSHLNVFGDRLRLQLKQLKPKSGQKYLAQAIGVSNRTVSAYINHRAVPTVPGLVRIAEVLGVSTDYLLGFTEEPNGLRPARDDDPLSRELLSVRQSYRSMSRRERLAVLALVTRLAGESGS